MFNVVDLFSGAGGMSLGFHRHPHFQMIAAADAEIGKPSCGKGALQCNSTYLANIGIAPVQMDLSMVEPADLKARLGLTPENDIHILSACPPCTGFSRQNPLNHLRDDHRNSLVGRAAEFATALNVDIVVMENARELLRGNFSYHFDSFKQHLENHGYSVYARNYLLTRFGLPQLRERAIVIAVKKGLPNHSLDDLWREMAVIPKTTHVRTAFERIDLTCTERDTYPRFSTLTVEKRLKAVPADGGSWMDLLKLKNGEELLTDAMRRIVAKGKIGSYPDVYGRMAWDRPSPTIKRECAHIGNGRYAHPAENRLCSVREMAKLQGFPDDYVFADTAVSNMYRHIGDAVPPLVSYQLAHVCQWILTGKKPLMEDIVLPGTSLYAKDIRLKDEKALYGPLFCQNKPGGTASFKRVSECVANAV